MMLDFISLVKTNKLNITGVIQIGAHVWQEKNILLGLGIHNFILIEPQPKVFAILQENANNIPGTILFNCALSDKQGQKEMFVETINQSQSSSLLQPKEHLNKYPYITFNEKIKVDVETLDNLDFDRKKYNTIIIDVQGAELMVFKGAKSTLKHIDFIYTEVNFIEMYKDCVLIKELDYYLKEFGFKRIATGENYNSQGWSDALYMK